MWTFYLIFKKCWRQIDAWLWENFEFGLYELGNLVTNFLIEVTT